MRIKLLGLFTAFVLAAFSSHPPEEFSTDVDTYNGPLVEGTVKITPIQHASLTIEAVGKIIYVDPAEGNFDGLRPADIILITDIHPDHLAPKIIEKLKKPNTIIIAPEAVAKTVPGVTVLRHGESKVIDTHALGEWKIQALPMYNLKPNAQGQIMHEKGRGNGYIVTYGELRIYIAGDTDGIPEMRALKNIDVAFIPMNPPYTMSPQEAADAVRAFHPKVVYPYHYRGSDPKVFAAALQGSGIDVRILNWYEQ
jgi:L-ascorbate metabolism protein UlaG (beta-lactamase superfamily)